MSSTLLRLCSTTCLFAISAGCLTATPPPSERYREVDGLIKIDPLPVPEQWQNPPLPEAEERAFWERANHVIQRYEGNINVRTEGEQEKESFPITMFNFFLGHEDRVMEQLQSRDRQADTDHAWTEGIDFYWGFTLKGQMRKYFYFGPALEPEYRQQMFDGAKIWTAENPRPSFELVHSLTSSDPMVREYALELLQKFRANIAELDSDAIEGSLEDQFAGEDLDEDPEKWYAWWIQYAVQGWQVYEDIERLANPYPHPLHGVGSGPVGARWDPSVRGMRTDARNTDNLRAMRDIAIYLMAEETENERVRRLYKDKIQRFVSNLYRYHHGEWDSENYLHHTIAPYHNLYDFAQDEDVVALAKAALDYLHASAAVKYYRGLAVAPTKRVGGGLDRYVWLAFGDTPEPKSRPYYDLVHPITSAYRPPMAVINIGKGQFDRPAEMINSKPNYSFWLPGGRDQPESWETVYYGRSHYLGSMVTTSAHWDARAFEIAMDRNNGGARSIRANSRSNINGIRRGDQIGQYRNILVWLRKDQNQEFHFQIPGETSAREENGIWFIEHDQTFLAIHPLNIRAEAFGRLNQSDSGQVEVKAPQTGGDFAGFALETGDREDFRNFSDFMEKILAADGLQEVDLETGEVTFQSLQGHTLGYRHHEENNLPIIYRDGERYDFLENKHVFRPMDDNAPLSLDWEGGTLTIEAGDARFEQTVHDDGTVTFSAEQ
ncbi:MAG: hypothetical protein JJT75_09015 [Opitutales bacterium]|nr:hypothetical protein [Opitutales bacterium]